MTKMTDYLSKKPGKLFVVATPLGNLADITYRAVTTLQDVDIIAVEDTRRSSALLKHYQIHRPLVQIHDYNEEKQSQSLIKKILDGLNIALISDAGTPLISDPGYRLVCQAHTAGIAVIPLPGPCAAIAALSVAGLPSDRFVFEGFLPPKTAARLERLKTLSMEQRTLLFYEAPHRILKLMDDLISIFGGDRFVVIGREITKMFETFYRGEVQNIKEKILADKNQQKGEFVVLVQGAVLPEITNQKVLDVLTLLLDELPMSRAVALTSKITGARKKDVYQLGLRTGLDLVML